MPRLLIGLMLLSLSIAATGCGVTRKITIRSVPPDAALKVDGVDAGKGPITQSFHFANEEETHRVTSTRLGYKDAEIKLTQEFTDPLLVIDMKPMTKTIKLRVEPAAAMFSIDGKGITTTPVDQISKELEFTVDSRNQWTSYEVLAERPGFEPVKQRVTWTDANSEYVLKLEPLRKEVKVTTNPDNARVSIDGIPAGVSPLMVSGVDFHIAPETGEWTTRTVRVEKPGYDPIDQVISWDEGKSEYHIDLAAKRKQVRILTDPPMAVVKIDGHVAEDRDESGAVLAELSFPPINEQGDLTTYEMQVSLTTEESEWYPATMPIAWEEGKEEYAVKLKEILTRPVDLTSLQVKKTDQGWQIVSGKQSTIAMKDTTEGKLRAAPTKLGQPQMNGNIDTLTVSPDGARIVFSVLFNTASGSPRAQLMSIRSDGSGGEEMLTDGTTLDIMPSCTPDGARIVFSSNRATNRMSIWEMAASGAPGMTQLTTGDNNDLWPVIDSDPKPRLFYQAHLDMRDLPKLFMTQLGTVARTDLTHLGGTQPRISPKADTLIFAAPNAKTGKRDLFRMPDSGGVPVNMTNTPDIDEFDPAWSSDGTRIAFVSDRGMDADKRANYDIWTIDAANSTQPTQVTANGSWDDSPSWDPSGDAIYFRSNRGGEWAIWKISVR